MSVWASREREGTDGVLEKHTEVGGHMRSLGKGSGTNICHGSVHDMESYEERCK